MTWNLTDRSLCQLRGISRDAECKYRRLGITDADSLLQYLKTNGPSQVARRVAPSVELFRCARQLGLTDVIVNMFPVGTRTRVVSDRYEKTLFLDIETDGRGPHAAVTLIGTCMDGHEHVYVKGSDLTDFLELWHRAEIIVSFNGKRFDAPVLMRTFGLTRIPAHVDLLDEARHYGLTGGLKEIEKSIGFFRKANSCSNGLEAIDLWHRFSTEGDGDALDVLMRYNIDDVRSLVHLYGYLLPLAKEEISDL